MKIPQVRFFMSDICNFTSKVVGQNTFMFHTSTLNREKLRIYGNKNSLKRSTKTRKKVTVALIQNILHARYAKRLFTFTEPQSFGNKIFELLAIIESKNLLLPCGKGSQPSPDVVLISYPHLSCKLHRKSQVSGCLFFH